MSSNTIHQVDQNLIKFSQACTISLISIGFLMDSWLPVAIATACQLLGASGWSVAPYQFLYNNLAKPLGIVKPNLKPDNSQPHHFASLVGGLMDLAGVVLLIAGSAVGWYSSALFSSWQTSISG